MAAPKLSVIVPAFNEEKLLPRCLASIRRAFANSLAGPFLHEVIVVDNNSTDATADVARAAGARVVFEPINQISRARNAGGAVATGDWFLFVDADSLLSGACVLDLLACLLRGGCAGGGCVVALEGAPRAGRLAMDALNALMRKLGWAAGSFVFCRAEAFRDVGGFTTAVYATEEIFFSEALKAWARERGLRVDILARHVHRSSARKFNLYSPWEMATLVARSVLFPWRTLRDKKALGYFYDGRR